MSTLDTVGMWLLVACIIMAVGVVALALLCIWDAANQELERMVRGWDAE